ncbi:MAG TPA: ABC transporter substrate-binding protein, partial [Anaerolineales bacterium]
MKRNVLFSLIAVLMVLSMLLSACGGGAATQAPAETEAPPAETEAPQAVDKVRVGAMYPLTGDLAKLGEENKNGLQLAIDEINAAGGIKALGGA